MKQVENGGHPFDAYYFADGCGRPYQRDEEWLNFFSSIAERIASDIQPDTVLDTGCAMGFLVEALREKEVEAYGVDISEYAIQNVIPDIQSYCWVGSVTEPFPRSYDLIVCIEVLEHLKPREAEKALENICHHTDDVLFSSTPFDYKEATHFNVQPPEHWAELFARQGFFRDVDYDALYITPWAARFRRKNEILPRLVRDYERRFWLLWKENTDLRSLATDLRSFTNDLQDQLVAGEAREQALSTRISDLHQTIDKVSHDFQAILNSRSWRLIKKIQRLRLKLIPLGSSRDRIFEFVIKAMGMKGHYSSPTRERDADKERRETRESEASKDESVWMPTISENYSPREREIGINDKRPCLALYSVDPLTSACPHLRIVGPAKHPNAGFKLIEGTSWKSGSIHISFPDEADIVVIQRDFPRYERLYGDVIEWARSQSKIVTYELDDLLLELPKEHPEKEYYDGARRQMLQAILEADAVIASTQCIAEYMRRFNPNTWLLPNYLDDRIWKLRDTQLADRPQLVIGYMGGMTKTHLPDLEIVTPVLKRLLHHYSDRLLLRFWGLVPLELVDLPNVEYQETSFPIYASFAEYFSTQECDVFIAPLRDNRFNRCKSWIKFLEYSALGIPGVYSSVGPYTEVVVHGENGFLASSVKDWEKYLPRLIEDSKLRVSVGRAAQETVRGRLLMSSHAHEWGIVYRAILSSGTSAKHDPPQELIDQQLRRWEREREAYQEAVRVEKDFPDLGERSSSKQTLRFNNKFTVLTKRALIVIRREGIKAFLKAVSRRLLIMPLKRGGLKSKKTTHVFRYPFERLGSLLQGKVLHVGPPPQVSIVIPVFNGLEYVRECVHSIYESPVSVPFEVIVVDQGSQDGALEFLRSFAKQRDDFRLIENQTNVGFVRAINQAAAIAEGEFLAIANSDIIVTASWLDRLVTAMRDDPTLGVVSPVTNYVGEGPQIDPDARDITSDQALIYAQRVSNRKGVKSVVDRLVFFCVLVRKKVFDHLGGLSDVFGLGNYEDDDFCLRARMAGFTLGIVPAAFVFHYGSRTFREQKIDHTELMLHNEKIFFERVCNFATRSPITGSQSKRAGPPSVSVVVRTKDRPYLLNQALTSLANQTFNDFEAVVINDGGVDVSSVIDKFSPNLNISYISHKVSKGRSAALNIGVATSRGHFITYLDDDDILYPTHLEHLYRALFTSSEYQVAYSDVNKALCWSDLCNDLILDRAPFTRRDYDQNALLVENWMPIMSLMHDADCVQTVGDFDETLEIFEDWDLLIRLSRAFSFLHIPHTTCEYRFRFGEGEEDSTLPSRELAVNTMTLIHNRYPVSDKSLQDQRAIALSASRQIIEEIQQLEALAQSEIAKRLLVTARLGGFILPHNLQEPSFQIVVKGS